MRWISSSFFQKNFYLYSKICSLVDRWSVLFICIYEAFIVSVFSVSIDSSQWNLLYVFEYTYSVDGIGLPIPMSESFAWNMYIVAHILVWKWGSQSWEWQWKASTMEIRFFDMRLGLRHARDSFQNAALQNFNANSRQHFPTVQWNVYLWLSAIDHFSINPNVRIIQSWRKKSNYNKIYCFFFSMKFICKF